MDSICLQKFMNYYMALRFFSFKNHLPMNAHPMHGCFFKHGITINLWIAQAHCIKLVVWYPVPKYIRLDIELH